MLSIPPFCFGTCKDGLSLQSPAILCGLEVKTAHNSRWEKRLKAVLGSRLTFLKWLSTEAGQIETSAQCWQNAVCSPHPPLYVSSCPMHSCSVLNWSLVMRTVCATHTLGSAVRGNGSIVTISLRNKLSAIHWGNYVSKHTGRSQCYTEQSLRLLWND